MVNISKNKEISGILDSKYYLETLFKRLLNILPDSSITDKNVLPYEETLRTMIEFLQLLKKNSRSITLM